MMDEIDRDTAAFEAHMVVIQVLTPALGRKPSATEVASVLAKAYGDAVAIAGVKSGPENAVVVGAVNEMAQQAYGEMLKTIISDSCAGSA